MDSFDSRFFFFPEDGHHPDLGGASWGEWDWGNYCYLSYKTIMRPNTGILSPKHIETSSFDVLCFFCVCILAFKIAKTELNDNLHH